MLLTAARSLKTKLRKVHKIMKIISSHIFSTLKFQNPAETEIKRKKVYMYLICLIRPDYDIINLDKCDYWLGLGIGLEILWIRLD